MSFFSKKQNILGQWIEKVEDRERVRVYKIKGDLDTFAAAKLDRFVNMMKGCKGFELKHVLLDFEDVKHIEISAVAALLRALRECAEKYHKLVLVNVHEQPQNILWLAKVAHLFPSYGSREEAIRELETRF